MSSWPSFIPARDSCSTARVPIGRRQISCQPVVFDLIRRVPLHPRLVVASSSSDPRRPRPCRLDHRIRCRLLRVARPLLTSTGVSPNGPLFYVSKLARPCYTMPSYASPCSTRSCYTRPNPTQASPGRAPPGQAGPTLLHLAQPDSDPAEGPLCTKTSA
jgi:hypothetical protein